MKYKFYIENLECANCAKKIEDVLNKDDKISSATINFATSKLSLRTDIKEPLAYVRKIVKEVEPNAIIINNPNQDVKKDHYFYLLLGGLMGLIGILIKVPFWLRIILIIGSYLLLLHRTFIVAIKQLQKKIISENFLIVISCIGAFILGEIEEGLMVIFLYELGKVIENKALNRSRKSITDLMDIKQETVNLKEENTIVKVATESVKKGSIIVVKEGEKIALDGIVIKGSAYLDTSAVTGESVPILVKENDKVLSGTINQKGLLEVKTTSLYEESTVNKILELVESATERKAKTETIVSKYASTYTILVLLISVLVAVFLPLFTDITYLDSIYKGLTILVISCPCAVAISVPLAYFSAIGASSRAGILIKGSNFLDNLRNISHIIFDKTGTITTGEFVVSEVIIFDHDYKKNDVLMLFAKGEAFSNHPLAKAIIKKYNHKVKTDDVKNFKEKAGMGISYVHNNNKIKIGNYKYCQIDDKNKNKIYLQVNGKVVAALLVVDEIKPNAERVIDKLQKMHIKVSMFTGDTKEKALEMAHFLGINNCQYEMLPQDKYHQLEKILSSKNTDDIISFVGDGLNDAPVIALSDLGISMGNIGSDSAIEASDVVITNDNLDKIIKAINISQKTNSIVKENIIFALTVKISVLILSFVGISTMWQAVFADVGVTIICLLNTLRLLKNKKNMF